jgi:hypothetical protein
MVKTKKVVPIAPNKNGPPHKMNIVWLAPQQLKPYEYNAKIHSHEKVVALANTIEREGWDQPIVVEPDYTIIKGHARREAAIYKGWKRVPVVVTTRDKWQAIVSRIADNKLAEAPWNPELLKFDFEILKAEDFDLGLTGFDLPAIEDLLTPPTSEEKYSERSHKDVGERKEEYDNSSVRQIILVTDPETFENIMADFARLQTEFGVETNIEVVQKLLELHAENRSK